MVDIINGQRREFEIILYTVLDTKIKNEKVNVVIRDLYGKIGRNCMRDGANITRLRYCINIFFCKIFFSLYDKGYHRKNITLRY